MSALFWIAAGFGFLHILAVCKSAREALSPPGIPHNNLGDGTWAGRVAPGSAEASPSPKQPRTASLHAARGGCKQRTAHSPSLLTLNPKLVA